jgi:hypothetical protein
MASSSLTLWGPNPDTWARPFYQCFGEAAADRWKRRRIAKAAAMQPRKEVLLSISAGTALSISLPEIVFIAPIASLITFLYLFELSSLSRLHSSPCL